MADEIINILGGPIKSLWLSLVPNQLINWFFYAIYIPFLSIYRQLFFCKHVLNINIRKKVIQWFEFSVSNVFDNLIEENKKDKDESKKPTWMIE